MPEFFYRPIYDDQHRLFPRVGGRLVKGPPMQKGLRESLLCLTCERQLARHEKYVCEMLFGGTSIMYTNHGDRIEVTGLDYLSVRLCYLSVLWRLSVATDKAWRMVQLGRHEERLRFMIRADNPGEPTEYGFFCAVPVFEGAHSPDFILGPDYIRADVGRYYRMILAGVITVFFVSKEPIPKKYRHLVVSREGRWVIPFVDAARVPFILEEAKRVEMATRNEH